MIGSDSKHQWNQVKLAELLSLSQPEISNSLGRSRYAGLLNDSGKTSESKPFLNSFNTELLMHSVKPGSLVRGIPTAHSAFPLNKLVISNGEDYVWPSATGQLRGQAISPLYKNVVKAVKGNRELHELLSLVDALRVGRVREKNLAIEELKKRLQ